MVRRRLPNGTRQPDRLGAGRRPGHPAVDGAAAGPLQRRDTAIVAVLTATGIRLSELADLRYTDADLWQREITVRGKGGKDWIVKIGHQAALSLDRYLRARVRHAQAWRPQLWLEANNR